MSHPSAAPLTIEDFERMLHRAPEPYRPPEYPWRLTCHVCGKRRTYLIVGAGPLPNPFTCEECERAP